MIKKSVWVLLLIFFACGEEAPDLILEDVSAYYPLSLEEFRVFDVERINYNFNVPDTSSYFLKEELVDSIVSSSGQVSYILQQSTRDDTTQLWMVDSIFTVRLQNRGLIRVENNIAYQKLAFPVSIGTEWNGNAFNNQSAQTYYYQSVGEIDSNDFYDDTSIKVIIEDIPRSFFSQDEKFEIYTKSIGLVEKNYIALNFCTDCNGEEGFINSGFILKQLLIEYGQK